MSEVFGGVRAGSHTVTVASSGERFDVEEGERILAAARRAGVWLPFECGWGSCATCKATVVEGETRLLFEGAPAVSERDVRRRRVLLCQSTPTSDLTLRPTWVEAGPRPERPTVDHRARLVRVEELGPAIARFRFVLDGPAQYRVGQFAVLELDSGLRRCYSMAGLPGTASVEFIAKRYQDGMGSGRLFDLAPGAELGIELPYGDLWLRDVDRPLLLVAGGTGISAILALLRQLAAQRDPRTIRLCYGATTVPELVCLGELTELAATLPDARLHPVVLRPDAAWAGAAGLVTEAVGPLLADPRMTAAEVYLAGPPPMVRAVQDVLRAGEVGLDRVHVDSFG